MEMKQLYYGNVEAEGGAIPLLSRNCDGNESRICHWMNRETGLSCSNCLNG
jgi:hypothetical protein